MCPRRQKNAPRLSGAGWVKRLFLRGGLGRVAVPGQRAALTPGGAGGTGVPAKQHHPVAEVAGLLGRNHLTELPLHLEGVLGPIGQA